MYFNLDFLDPPRERRFSLDAINQLDKERSHHPKRKLEDSDGNNINPKRQKLFSLLLDDLPQELRFEIFKILDTNSLANLRAVNSILREECMVFINIKINYEWNEAFSKFPKLKKLLPETEHIPTFIPQKSKLDLLAFMSLNSSILKYTDPISKNKNIVVITKSCQESSQFNSYSNLTIEISSKNLAIKLLPTYFSSIFLFQNNFHFENQEELSSFLTTFFTTGSATWYPPTVMNSIGLGYFCIFPINVTLVDVADLKNNS